jgi:hypothetical protein
VPTAALRMASTVHIACIALIGACVAAAAGSGDAVKRICPALDAMGRTFVIGETPAQANLLKLTGNFLITCWLQDGSRTEGQSPDPARDREARGAPALRWNCTFLAALAHGDGDFDWSAIAKRAADDAGVGHG